MQALPERPRSILVVEDDPAIAQLLARVLAEEEQYQVRIASDGSRALELAAAQPPALVMLDLNLPGMTGQQFYAEFRARGFTASVLVISASATGAQQARGMGADSFIAKPFDIDTVLTEVKQLLRA